MEAVGEGGRDLDEVVVLQFGLEGVVVAGSDVDVAVSDAEVVGVGLVEVVAHCESLHDERSGEAGCDVDDSVLGE